ncbi:HVA1 family protein [Nostoc sp. LPT]|nr:HVA1 family protein [Nostoc sp. LPT]MBN4001973.1 HVA1 family protein [Nostoc sp. LPT]
MVIAASQDNPEHLVETDKTGKQVAYKPDALKKVEE